MPQRRAMQVCPTPGCATLTPGGRCEPCQTKAQRQRPTAASKGYDTRLGPHTRRIPQSPPPVPVRRMRGDGPAAASPRDRGQ